MHKSLLQIILLILVLNSLGTPLKAQDPYFSQFFANRVYLNPAYAGFDPGVTVELNYRDQWFGLPDASSGPFKAGFRTYNATANWQMPCLPQSENIALGFALSAFHDEAGAAPLITTGFALAGSFRIGGVPGNGSRSSLKEWSLTLGSQFSLAQQKLEGDYLIYSGQLDHVVGLNGFDPSIANFRSNTYGNFNIGLLLRGRISKSRNREALYSIGLSLNNVTEPNISLSGGATNVHLPLRSTFHISSTHKIAIMKGTIKPWYITPQFRWDRQLNGLLNLQTVGFYAFRKAYIGGAFIQYNFPKNPLPNPNTISSLRARNTTTIILHSSLDLRSHFNWGRGPGRDKSGIILGLSYDIPITGVGAESALGVLEISLKMNFERPHSKQCRPSISPMEMYQDCPWRH